MHKFISSSLFTTLILGSLTLGACEDSSGSEPVALPGEQVSSALERNLAPNVSAADKEALAAGNNAFAVDAYQTLAAGNTDNLFYSPLSVSMAMAMVYGGARGTTEEQMAAALHFSLPQETLHPAISWLDLELQSRGQGASGADGGGFRLNILNGVFGQKGYSFLDSYLDLLAVNYGAGLSLLDFESDAEGSRELINGWVADATEDRITDLLPPGIIQSSTRMVLANAVYFNAAWAKKFNPDTTSDGVFHGVNGEVTVPMMNDTIPVSRASGQGYQAFSMAYDGDELDMVVILPDEGQFDALEAALSGEKIAEIFGALAPAGSLQLSFPRFEFRTNADFVPVFRELGLVDAFDNPDLSGIDGTRDLAITGIVHQAVVKVTEGGTEAAAATGVVIGPTSVPEFLAIDRPFIFLIRDIETSSVVFMGRVLDPSL